MDRFVALKRDAPAWKSPLVVIARHDDEASLDRVRPSLLQPAAWHEQFLGDVQAMMPVRALQ